MSPIGAIGQHGVGYRVLSRGALRTLRAGRRCPYAPVLRTQCSDLLEAIEVVTTIIQIAGSYGGYLIRPRSISTVS
jgi:hypothetical protein